MHNMEQLENIIQESSLKTRQIAVELTSKRKRIKELLAEVDKLKLENHQKSLEIDVLKQSNRDKDLQFKAAREKCSMLEDSFKQEHSNKQYKIRFEEAEVRVQAVYESLRNSENNLSEWKRKFEDLEPKLISVRMALNEYKIERDFLKTELKQMSSAINLSKSNAEELTKLKSRFIILQNKVKMDTFFTNIIDRIKTENKSLQEQNCKLKANLNEKMNQISLLNNRSSESELMNSSPWVQKLSNYHEESIQWMNEIGTNLSKRMSEERNANEHLIRLVNELREKCEIQRKKLAEFELKAGKHSV